MPAVGLSLGDETKQREVIIAGMCTYYYNALISDSVTVVTEQSSVVD